MLDSDLCRAEHMAGRIKGDGDAADAKRFAEPGCLGRTGEILSAAQCHYIERLPARQHRAMAGAGMVGMAVGDQRPRHRTHGIDEEIAGRAVEALRCRTEEVAGAHEA